MALANPDDLHRTFAAAANAGDIDALAALYEPDAVIVEHTGELTVGTEEIRSHLEALIGLSPKMSILASRVARAGDTALACSRWHATATMPDGQAVEMEHGGSEVLRRQPDGTWRLVIDNPWGAHVGG